MFTKILSEIIVKRECLKVLIVTVYHEASIDVASSLLYVKYDIVQS